MSSPAFAGREALRPVQSRLGQSLIRLHESVQQQQREDKRAESSFADWQRKWSSRRKQISRRLALIEKQLSQLDAAGESPQLNLFLSSDAEELIGSAVHA